MAPGRTLTVVRFRFSLSGNRGLPTELCGVPGGVLLSFIVDFIPRDFRPECNKKR
jgi:hypothetical protein